jgi:hypothetical protein
MAHPLSYSLQDLGFAHRRSSLDGTIERIGVENGIINVEPT